MFIKSVLLNGFKSFAECVEITDFDPSFNAITGYNGAGKSNILDALCFVLGITNLSVMRAHNFQDYIYMQGNQRVKEAVVSVKFDNSDKLHSPIGFTDYEEITVTRQVLWNGQDTCLINDVEVPMQEVNDMLRSANLDVNLSYFIIMQNRIHDVLDMTPQEILSKFHEVVGMMRFEEQKQSAIADINKKDVKLRELQKVTYQSVLPQRQGHNEERHQQHEYERVLKELESVTRRHIAYKYYMFSESYKLVDMKLTSFDSKEKSHRKSADLLEQLLWEINKHEVRQTGNTIRQLESELQELKQAEAVAVSAYKASHEELVSHNKRSQLVQQALVEDESALAAKKDLFDKMSSTYESLRAASSASQVALAEAQQRFMDACSGNGGVCSSLLDQLMAATIEAAEAEVGISKIMMEMKDAEERLEDLQREFNSWSDQKNIVTQQVQIDKIQSEQSSVNIGQECELQSVCELQSAVCNKREAAERLAEQLQHCDFKYQQPQPNFDRSRVIGTICRLINVCDPKYCTALEAVAEGRLYDVVVDTEETSNLLLQYGQLKTRTTFIALDKIIGQVIDRDTVEFAQNIGGGLENVQLALDLISFESHLRPAMAWVFGETLVCCNLETAKNVAYHPVVRCRCVTLGGHMFDPSGTMSGGAMGESVLLQLKKLKQLEGELQAGEAPLAREAAKLDSMQHAAATQHRCVMMSHESTSSAAQLSDEILKFRVKIAALKADVTYDKMKQDETVAQVTALQSKVKDIKERREFKEAEAALTKAAKEAKICAIESNQREQELLTLEPKVMKLQAAVLNGRQQVEKAGNITQELKNNIERTKEEHILASEAIREKVTQLKQAQAMLASTSKHVSQLNQKKEQTTENRDEIKQTISGLDDSIQKMNAEAAEYMEKMKALEEEYPWIVRERTTFGVPGSKYDFVAYQPRVMEQRIAQLTAKKQELSRVMDEASPANKLERNYQMLLKMIATVQADRRKLVETITILDHQKKDMLQYACNKLNEDFNGIFKSFLPGGQAKLAPPDGLTITEGLEVKVGFNDTWQESPDDLSGGERTLLALSLLMAFLNQNPAPLYVLDSVDATLDRNHTIVNTLKKYFPNSQFIVVAMGSMLLSEAKVLFNVTMVNGKSSVERTERR